MRFAHADDGAIWGKTVPKPRGSVTPERVLRLLLMAFLVAILTTSPSRAWWATGHKTVCQIAWQELAPATRAAIEELLGGEESSFPEACVWADEIKNAPNYRRTRPHHYINLPPDAAAIYLDRDCPPRAGCLVRAIGCHSAALRDREFPRDERIEALKFLGHFVGDVHQPLHAGYQRDRGGNDIEVELFGKRTDLHKVWDGQMLEHELERRGKPWREMAEELYRETTAEERIAWRGAQPIDWAFQSFRLAEQSAYREPAGGFYLGQDYVDRHLPVAKAQLRKAGVRLAEFLDAAFSAEATLQPQVQAGSADPVYYASTERLTGHELHKALHAIVREHERLDYRKVWEALRSTDEDPSNPANVVLVYTQRSEHKNRTQRSCLGDRNAWNREHVWPTSHGFQEKSQPAHTDLHHLRPADRTINSSRGDKDFDNGGEPHGEANDARADTDSFAPPGTVKGDVARMIFYMAVRYEGEGGEPDLEISKTVTQSGTPTLGRLCTLLSWHRQDRVDNWERRRNNRIQALQGNRNPFIDRPQWAEALWGEQCSRE